MAVPNHLDEAVSRLDDARLRIEACRERPTELKVLRDWMEALTDYVRTLAEIHEYTNESVHEKLHSLGRRVRHEEAVKPIEEHHIEPHPLAP